MSHADFLDRASPGVECPAMPQAGRFAFGPFRPDPRETAAQERRAVNLSPRQSDVMLTLVTRAGAGGAAVAGKMKAATLLGCVLIIAAACGPRRVQPEVVPRQPNLAEAFDVALDRIKLHGGALDAVVLGPSIDEAITAVLKREHSGAALKDAPSRPGFALPARYFLLTSFQLTGDSGTLSGTLGPVGTPGPAASLLACGTTFNIVLDRTSTSGMWRATVSSLTVC